VNVHFVHGWGFGPSVWEKLAPLLPNKSTSIFDGGYFGAPTAHFPQEPAIWITHSFGTILALAAIPGNCRALVAINGFDRFVSGDGAVGVAPRVLDRMLERFDSDPAGVLSDFRRRCGSEEPVQDAQTERLAHDLVALRDMDCREDAASLSIPVLSLQAAQDPIVTADMRSRALQSIANIRHRVHPTAGHLLPTQDPKWCAEHISAFLAEAC
jgi:pimeloyl-[acyl-carrier protein] methyl ester esterase